MHFCRCLLGRNNSKTFHHGFSRRKRGVILIVLVSSNHIWLREKYVLLQRRQDQLSLLVTCVIVSHWCPWFLLEVETFSQSLTWFVVHQCSDKEHVESLNWCFGMHWMRDHQFQTDDQTSLLNVDETQCFSVWPHLLATTHWNDHGCTSGSYHCCHFTWHSWGVCNWQIQRLS